MRGYRFLLALLPLLSVLAGSRPIIDYSDLISGPANGGEQGQGAFITIYGRNFGATRGTSTITVGGAPVAAYPLWSDTRIAIQLGSQAQSGSIALTTAGGVSNAVPFTVQPGNIYFVGPGGSDAAAGSASAPWATLRKALGNTAAGDIVYLKDGFQFTGLDGWDSSLLLSISGLPDRPRAIAAYPGASVQIGGGVRYGVRATTTVNYWTFANLSFTGGAYTALALNGTGLRLVGNTFSCPKCSSLNGTAAVQGNNAVILGNEIKESGTSAAAVSRLYHSLSTGGNNLDIGWNYIHGGASCDGIRVHAEGSTGFANVAIHDNRIADQRCVAIDLSTINPTAGPVQVYNNVVTHSGTGGYHTGLTMYSYACLATRGLGTASATGDLIIANNTFHDCASVLNSTNEGYAATFLLQASQSGIRTRLDDNITSNPAYLYSPSRNTYFATGSITGALTGAGNLWWGDGEGPAYLAGNINGNPAFVNAALRDYHLSAGSPAIAAGVQTDFTTDAEGRPRPAGKFDIGAYQSESQAPPPPPVVYLVGTLSCLPGTLTEGTTASCTATISPAAPTTGLTLNLSSTSPLLTLPATATVPPAGSTAAFSVRAAGITSPAPALVKAAYGTSSASFTFALSAAPVLPVSSYFVATIGSDSTGTGSLTNPWRTIVKAVGRAVAGDTIHVRAGKYMEAVVLNARGTEAAPITLRAYPGETVILDGNARTLRLGLQFGPTATDWVIQDLTIQNYKSIAIWAPGVNNRLTLRNLRLQYNISGIGFTNSDGSRLENVNIFENDLIGFDCTPPSPTTQPGCTNLTIQDSSAIRTLGGNNTGWDGFGIEQGNKITFLRCVSAGAPGDGFDVKGTNVTIDRVMAYNNRNNLKLWRGNSTVRNSVFYDAKADSNVLLLGQSGETFVLENNTIVNMGAKAYQLVLSYGSLVPTTVTMQNNIVYNDNSAQTGTIFYVNPTVTLRAANNLYYNPYRTDAVICVGAQCYSSTQILAGAWPEAGARYANPLFVNATGKDFHLSATSPAVDAGTLTAAPADQDGTLSPQGLSMDIGAYERKQ